MVNVDIQPHDLRENTASSMQLQRQDSPFLQALSRATPRVSFARIPSEKRTQIWSLFFVVPLCSRMLSRLSSTVMGTLSSRHISRSCDVIFLGSKKLPLAPSIWKSATSRTGRERVRQGIVMWNLPPIWFNHGRGYRRSLSQLRFFSSIWHPRAHSNSHAQAMTILSHRPYANGFPKPLTTYELLHIFMWLSRWVTAHTQTTNAHTTPPFSMNAGTLQQSHPNLLHDNLLGDKIEDPKT